jgi:hypothetical protein
MDGRGSREELGRGEPISRSVRSDGDKESGVLREVILSRKSRTS